MQRYGVLVLGLVVLVSSLAPLAAAQGIAVRESRDVPVTLALWAFSAWGESLQADRRACNWCDRDAEGRDAINGFDRRLRWKNLSPEARKNAHTVSNYTLAASTLGLAVAVPVLAHQDEGRVMWENALICAETLAVTTALQGLTRYSFGRQRPYAHKNDFIYGAPEENDNLSFYSGHSALAFSGALCGYRVARLRGDGFAKPALYVGLTVATATAVLRVRADKHYASDVAVGPVTGSLIGYLWPGRFVGKGEKVASVRPTVAPTAQGLAVGLEASW